MTGLENLTQTIGRTGRSNRRRARAIGYAQVALVLALYAAAFITFAL